MRKIFVALALMGALTGALEARPRYPRDPVPPLPVGSVTNPISAWTEMCRVYPGECSFNPAEPERVSLSADMLAFVLKVNRTVNAAVAPVEDQAHWGVADRWNFAEDGKGDCEDYQLLKRRLLVGLGVPRRALRMTVVIDEIGAGHAVLMLRTTHGEFILDNKRNAVLSWNDTGYTFVKRESSSNPGEWVALVPVPVEITGAP